MVSFEYANAYSEVLEILRCIPKEDYDKIPKEKISLFETNSNKEYDFTYDMNKTLDEQNVSKKAKTIIAILFRDYWATDTQKEKIKAKEKYDKQIKEQEIGKKYNNENIYNNNVKKERVDKSNEIILYKDSLIKRIINKILNLIKLKND